MDVDTQGQLRSDVANAIVSVHFPKFEELLTSSYSQGCKDTEERIRKWADNEKNQKYTEGGDEAVIVDDLLALLKK
jgi:hypothetical protein